MQIYRIIKKFIKLPWHQKLLHLEAFFLQLSTGLLLKIIPFRYILKLFAAPSPFTPQVPSLTSHLSLLDTLEDIKHANLNVSALSHWKNKCLVKSLAARKMLNRRGIHSQLSLGVIKGDNSKTIAHAWLKSGDFEVIEKNGEYYELYLF